MYSYYEHVSAHHMYNNSLEVDVQFTMNNKLLYMGSGNGFLRSGQLSLPRWLNTMNVLGLVLI